MPSFPLSSVLLALIASHGVVAAPQARAASDARGASSRLEHQPPQSENQPTSFHGNAPDSTHPVTSMTNVKPTTQTKATSAQSTPLSMTSQVPGPTITAGRAIGAQLRLLAAVSSVSSSRVVNSQGVSPGPTALVTQLGYWTPIPGAPNPTTPPNVRILSSQLLGNVTPDNSRAARDLGWHGTINGIGINSYGDTAQCQVGATLNNCWDGTNFVGSNSAAYSTNNPLIVHDFNLDLAGRPKQFCQTLNTPVERSNIYFAIGISNVVQTSANTGIIYTVANNRTFTANQNMGAGFASVSVAGSYPVCTRTQTNMWSVYEPLYGDTNAMDGGDGYIYAFGSYGAYSDGMLVYLARVPVSQAFTLSAYQYWDQSTQTWSYNRMYNPRPSQAVLQGVPNAQPFWSPYLKKFVMLARNPVDLWGIDIMTASQLSGPWSGRLAVYRETNWIPTQISIYGPAPQPQYDPTGKTLTFTYAIWGNHLQAAKITFA